MPVSEIELACLVTSPFFFSDQFFWASRVQRLGVRVLTTSVHHLSLIVFFFQQKVGLKLSSVNSGELAEALKKATTDV